MRFYELNWKTRTWWHARKVVPREAMDVDVDFAADGCTRVIITQFTVTPSRPINEQSPRFTFRHDPSRRRACRRIHQDRLARAQLRTGRDP